MRNSKLINKHINIQTSFNQCVLVRYNPNDHTFIPTGALMLVTLTQHQRVWHTS
jgi:hypothetical protein